MGFSVSDFVFGGNSPFFSGRLNGRRFHRAFGCSRRYPNFGGIANDLLLPSKLPLAGSYAGDAETAQDSFKRDREKLKAEFKLSGSEVGLRALSLVNIYHTGFRNDLFTPDAHHPVRIGLIFELCRNGFEKAGIIPALVKARALAHDLPETHNDLTEARLAVQLGGGPDAASVARSAVTLNKKRKESKPLTLLEYHEGLLPDPIDVLVKLSDCVDNMRTIFGLKLPKRAENLAESVALAKVSRRARFPNDEIEEFAETLRQYILLIDKHFPKMAGMVAKGQIIPDALKVALELERLERAAKLRFPFPVYSAAWLHPSRTQPRGVEVA